jgi:hypothetical protein
MVTVFVTGAPIATRGRPTDVMAVLNSDIERRNEVRIREYMPRSYQSIKATAEVGARSPACRGPIIDDDKHTVDSDRAPLPAKRVE